MVEIEWDQADALPFPLCLSSINQGGAAIEDVSIARGNVVLADHGETRAEEDLIFTGDGEFGVTLGYSPLTHSIPLPVDHRNGRRQNSDSSARKLASHRSG